MSVFTYLKLPVVLTNTALSTTYAAISYPFATDTSSSTFKQHVAFSALRSLVTNCNSLNLSLPSIQPTTQQQYEACAKRNSFSPLLESEDSHIHGFWIGNPTAAKKVLIWYHGGGYTAPATEHHMNFLWDLFKRVTKQQADPSFAIFIQRYDLASLGFSYPTQLRQAAHTLNYLQTQLHFSPSQLLLAGDSAGGHLTLSILSHLLHAHADTSIPRLTPHSQPPFAGALLVSPWTSFTTTTPSMTTNLQTDYLPPSALQKWSHDFLASAPADNYNESNLADASWWNGLDKVVSQIGVTAGSGEVLVDGIRETVEKMRRGWSSSSPGTAGMKQGERPGGEGGQKDRFVYVEAPGECHDMMLTAGVLGDWYMQRSETVRFIREWVVERAGA